MKWIILLGAIISNAAASGLLRIATNPPFQFPSIKDSTSIIYNWPFWLGLISYGISFLFYAEALSSMPLNIAYPNTVKD